MSDDVIVSGGGSTAVATGQLFSDATGLREVSGALHDCADRLSALERVDASRRPLAGSALASAMKANRAIDDAAIALSRAIPRVQTLRLALIASAEAYGFVERSVATMTREVAARFGNVLGLALPFIAVAMLPWVVGIGGEAALGIALLPAEARSALFAALPDWFRTHSAFITDPTVVQLVRLSVMSLDDVGLGLVRLPPDLARLLGDEGLGVVGVATSAAVTVRLAHGVGGLVETPVSVRRVSPPTPVTPPVTLVDRVDRIPRGPAQVRIDRFIEEGEPDRFEVYIGGTRDFSLVAGSEPWDMTSNINAIGGAETGSYRSVQLAMHDAGVTTSSPVIFNGYSQGGLIAAQLAASGDFETRGLYTLGAPAAQVEVPTGIPYVAIEHTDDIVPALGGTWTTSDPVLVRRELFDGDTPVDTSQTFPAHRLPYYRQTAAIADDSNEPRLVGALGSFQSLGDHATRVESTLYQAERVKEVQR